MKQELSHKTGSVTQNGINHITRGPNIRRSLSVVSKQRMPDQPHITRSVKVNMTFLDLDLVWKLKYLYNSPEENILW